MAKGKTELDTSWYNWHTVQIDMARQHLMNALTIIRDRPQTFKRQSPASLEIARNQLRAAIGRLDASLTPWELNQAQVMELIDKLPRGTPKRKE